MKKVYVIGSKGIPANYGGFETFIDRLVSGQKSPIDYIITGMGDENREYRYRGARCVQFQTRDSAIGRMLHTLHALVFVYKDAKSTLDLRETSPDPGSTSTNSGTKILYVLGCRAGLFLWLSKGLLKKQNIEILVNPDGAEWKRAKWSWLAKIIVKFYERCLIASADIVVCDARAILQIIHDDFKVDRSKLKFIAYGTDIYDETTHVSHELELKYMQWLEVNETSGRPYYLMVGRFVPENNFELIIREFMLSKTSSSLIIVSNVSDNKFFQTLATKTGMKKDSRIKFIGTLYDQDLLKLIRARATAYIHGHEVGGTNPSLLEALGSTNVNLIFDVSFNKEVAGDTGYYFDDSTGSLAKLIDETDSLTNDAMNNMGAIAKERINKYYNWHDIISSYEELFIGENR